MGEVEVADVVWWDAEEQVRVCCFSCLTATSCLAAYTGCHTPKKCIHLAKSTYAQCRSITLKIATPHQ